MSAVNARYVRRYCTGIGDALSDIGLAKAELSPPARQDSKRRRAGRIQETARSRPATRRRTTLPLLMPVPILDRPTSPGCSRRSARSSRRSCARAQVRIPEELLWVDGARGQEAPGQTRDSRRSRWRRFFSICASWVEPCFPASFSRIGRQVITRWSTSARASTNVVRRMPCRRVVLRANDGKTVGRRHPCLHLHPHASQCVPSLCQSADAMREVFLLSTTATPRARISANACALSLPISQLLHQMVLDRLFGHCRAA